jgi:hypothetical protein
MFLLNHVSPEKATNAIGEIYSVFPKEIGPPHTLQLMSASPGFLACRGAEPIPAIYRNIEF